MKEASRNTMFLGLPDVICVFQRYFWYLNDMRPKLMAEDSTLTHFSVSTKVAELWKDVRQRNPINHSADLIDLHSVMRGFRQ